MNKWIFLLVVAMLLLGTITSFAENPSNLTPNEANEASIEFSDDFLEDEEFSKLEELINNWEEEGYPDNLGYIYYDDSQRKYVIGVVEGGEGKENILKPDVFAFENVLLERASYSYSEILNLQNIIIEDLSKEEGIYAVSFDVITSDGNQPRFGLKEIESRVVIAVDKNRLEEYRKKYQKQYGDMVYVEIGSLAYADEEMGPTDGRLKETIRLYLIIFAVLCMAIASMLILKERELILAKEAPDGTLITESRPLTRKEVISIVKDSSIIPSDHVYKSIAKEIYLTRNEE